MTTRPIAAAVVGHTNTGKTSLMRTLLRDAAFGEVSDRPAVTRHVEGATLLLNGEPALELYDTPGLEDSIGLREHLDRLAGSEVRDATAAVEAMLASDAARDQFAQEAKAIRQVMASDVALYVIDARQRILAKYRDELAILARCGRPVVPVLNFIASDDARTAEWRDQLARLNLHAVAEFDTVVFDELGEQRLFEKMRTLLDKHEATLNALIEDRRQQRELLIQASARRIAELLLDAAGAVRIVTADRHHPREEDLESLRDDIRRAEQQCVDDLLALHRFRPEDCHPDQLPLEQGQWDMDLFSQEALRRFGVATGGAAAAGAMAGLTVDIMLGGVTLGAMTGLGAATGGLLGATKTHGKRFYERLRGKRELRCDDATLLLLARRQITLVHALLRRGHASQEPIQLADRNDKRSDARAARRKQPRLPHELAAARWNPRWSSLNRTGAASLIGATKHEEAIEAIAADLARALHRGDPTWP